MIGTRTILWTIAGAAGAIAGIAAIADHRRARRADLDRVGWAPWGAVQMIALFAAIICAALALRTGEG